MAIRRLSETSIYKYLGTAKGENFDKKVKAFMEDKSTMVVYKRDLEDTMLRMQSRSFGRDTKTLLDKIGNGITLVYNPTVPLPTALPFWHKNTSSGAKGLVVNISNHCTRNKNGTFTAISPFLLYTLLLGGWYSLVIDGSTDSVLVNSGVPELYGRMMATTVAKLAPVDAVGADELRYIFTKFFYMNMYGFDMNKESRVITKCMKNAPHISPGLLSNLDASVPFDKNTTLESLIETMRTDKGHGIPVPCMTNVGFYQIFDRWIRAYGEPSAFSIEHVPYFITSVIAMMMGCNEYVNVTGMEREAAKQDKGQFAKMIASIEGTIK